MYFGTHAMRYGSRAMSVRRVLQDTDIVLIQRGLYPMGPSAVATPLRQFDGRLVLDLDDAIFQLKPALARRSAPTRWLYGPQQSRAILSRADAIIVSSEELAQQLPDDAVRPVLIPTVPDPAHYQMVQHEQEKDGPIRVGWAGTSGNLVYLDELHDVFRRLGHARLAELEVVSSEPWSGPSSFHRWQLDEEIAVFDRFSIGIMPLPDTPYTRAKAGFKLLQYMAAGLPVVASPVGVNRELVESSGAGLLATSPAEWECAL
jgi:hypothetical protein